MKTLDEVIKAFSEAIKEVGCGDCQFNDAESDDIPCEMTDCIFTDALHHLKEYRWVQENCADALAEKYPSENVPLTWSELKLMEEKPVWVEEKGMLSIWIIIRDVTENWLYSTDCNAYRHEEYGKTWQAYRKERK